MPKSVWGSAEGAGRENGKGQEFWILWVLSSVGLGLLTNDLGLGDGLRGRDMQFSKPLYIFIGYFVRLRNDFKAIAYHAVHNIRSIPPLDGEESPSHCQDSKPRFSSTHALASTDFGVSITTEPSFLTRTSAMTLSLDEQPPSCTFYVIDLAPTK
jgi:hypothetical protein